MSRLVLLAAALAVPSMLAASVSDLATAQQATVLAANAATVNCPVVD